MTELKSTTPVSPSFEEGIVKSYKLYSDPLYGYRDVVLIGDSLAERFPSEYLEKNLVENLGVGGDRTENVLWRLDKFCHDELNPRYILLFIGINNIWEGDRGEDVAAAIERIVAKLESLWPNAVLFSVGIPPFGANLKHNDLERKIVNSKSEKLNARFIDLDEIVLNWPNGEREDFYEADMIHISNLGYLEISRAFICQSNIVP